MTDRLRIATSLLALALPAAATAVETQPAAAAPAASAMVQIPAGRLRFGGGAKEAAVLARVQAQLTEAARAELRRVPATAALADAADLAAVTAAHTAAAASHKQAGAAVKKAAADSPELAAARAAEAAAQAELAPLTVAKTKLELASKMPAWMDNEIPVVEVEVAAFSIDRYEVTVAEYQAFCTATNRTMPGPYLAAVAGTTKSRSFPETIHPSFKEPRSPITGLGFMEAKAYAEWAGKRLPTEIEWEYAARGGVDTAFPWGDQPWDGTQANLASVGLTAINARYAGIASHTVIDDGHPCVAPVGSYPPNAFGLYDMVGNAAEWCDGKPWFQDYLVRKLAKTLPADFVEPTSSDIYLWNKPRDQFQPLRGSGYNSSEYDARLSRRYGPPITHGEPERGLRCCAIKP